MSFFAKNSGRRWFALLSVILFVVTAAQSILYLTCYDFELGLYVQGFPIGALKLAYLLVALLSVSGLIVLPLIAIKKQASSAIPLDGHPAPSRAADLFALLCGALIAGTLITQLVRINADDQLSILLLNPAQTNMNAHYSLLASLILALPALLYFVGIFAGKKWSFAPLLTLVWVCAYMLRVYFDAELLLMSPTRQLTLAALCAIALFLIAEMRLIRGIFSPIFYGIAATLAALFAGASGFGALLLTIVGRLPLSTETIYYAFQLTAALYALFRMRSLLSPIFAARDRAAEEVA